MKLTKRERVLLTVLAAVVGLSALWFFVAQPVLLDLDAKRAQYSDLEVQMVQMQNAAAMTDAAEGEFEKQQEQAQGNYDDFYATLNSYTIDDIINGLLADSALEVESLSISPYESVSDAELFGVSDEEGTEADTGCLLRSTVRLQAGGAYEDILRFVDGMNAKSFCLRVSELSVTMSGGAYKYDYEARLVCTVYIYGIEEPDGLEKL